MKTGKCAFRRFLRNEQGLETVEYAVMAGIITAAAILAISALGTTVAGLFNNLVGKF